MMTHIASALSTMLDCCLCTGVVTSDYAKQLVHCGSVWYWLVVASIVPLVALFCIIVRRYLIRRYQLKRELGLTSARDEVQWDARNTVLYPALCSLAGLVAGMFGVGGGIVKVSMMPHACVTTLRLLRSFNDLTNWQGSAFALQYRPSGSSLVCWGFNTRSRPYRDHPIRQRTPNRPKHSAVVVPVRS